MRYYNSFIAGGVAVLVTVLLYVGLSLIFSFERFEDPSGLIGATSFELSISPFFLLLVVMAFATGFLWKLTRTSNR